MENKTEGLKELTEKTEGFAARMGGKEWDGALRDRVGSCMFCGQTIMVKATADADERTLDRLATDACTCEAAKDWQFKQDQKTFAEKKIDEFCANAAVNGILKDQIEYIQNKDYQSLQIITEDGVAFSIKRTVTGKLKIKAKTTLVQEEEA